MIACQLHSLVLLLALAVPAAAQRHVLMFVIDDLGEHIIQLHTLLTAVHRVRRCVIQGGPIRVLDTQS